MEALGEEAGWKREDEGGQAMESLGPGAREERTEAREERTEAREEKLEAREERLEAREERTGAKERVENRKEKRSFFIKGCIKKGEI